MRSHLAAKRRFVVQDKRLLVERAGERTTIGIDLDFI